MFNFAQFAQPCSASKRPDTREITIMPKRVLDSEEDGDFQPSNCAADDDDFDVVTKPAVADDKKQQQKKKAPAAGEKAKSAEPKTSKKEKPKEAPDAGTSAAAISTAVAQPAAAKAAAGGSKAAKASTGLDVVVDYIIALNAPLNAQMVADKFRGSISKPAAEKHLAALAETGQIKMKENGKVFVPNAHTHA